MLKKVVSVILTFSILFTSAAPVSRAADTLTEIGEGAFENSSLECIVLPDSLKKLGIYAFAGINNIKKVHYLFCGKFAVGGNYNLARNNVDGDGGI